MFTPKWKKHAKLLYKGSQKFLHYKRDLLSEDRIDEVESRRKDLKDAIKNGDKEQAKEAGKLLEKTCEQALPRYRGNSAIQENLEVIFVAIVVALGIRTYFLQPFRIPTNSMYPTLNGITGQALPQDQWPSAAVRLAQHASHGRNYFSIKTDTECRILSIEKYQWMHFFSRVRIRFDDGKTETFSGSETSIFQAGLTKLLDKLVKEQHPQLWYNHYRNLPPELRGQAYLSTEIQKGKYLNIYKNVTFPANTTIAEGYSQTGDLILVDKVSYHFRKPKAGEVFVFDTRGIETRSKDQIRAGIPKDDTHYIKRLVGTPGDHLRLVRAKEATEEYPIGGILFRNNAPAKEPGILAVQSLQDKYNGYSLETKINMIRGVKLRNRPSTGLSEYWAMGDNSFNSGDSRSWGSVKEYNVVGPAFFQLWPFGSGHWGTIK